MFWILSIEFVSGYLDIDVLSMWLYMLQSLSVKMEMHTDFFNVMLENILKGVNPDATHIMNNMDSLWNYL